MGKPAIVFIGFMGAGKSTALKAAEKAGLVTTETDALIEAELGCSIPEAFERHGEAGFRERESELVGTLLEEASGGAIALGGGSVLSERVREALGRHTVVWLEVDAETAWQRVAKSDRPLVTRGRDAFEALLAERTPIYESVADAVLPAEDSATTARALPAIEALAELPVGTRLLWAASGSGEYPVYVGRGLLDACAAGWWPLEGRRFCVTDEAVGPLYAGQLGPLTGRVAIAPGEFSKSIERAEKVLEALLSADMTRQDHVVALGGGVVGDLAGLCAHLYQRGVPVVHVPTTLVAQVDSAYGGKTGVDLPEGKNYVGAYHSPAAVLADTATLETLPLAELTAGFVEVLKTGLLAGGALWERVRKIDTLPSPLDDVVFECARYKCAVVAADERDAGLRQVLNLGHTIGHAIEAVSGFASPEDGGLRHGEAVGLGLLAALRLSGADDLRAEVRRILDDFSLPLRVRVESRPEDIVDLIQRDKKRTAAGVGFVLLREPGRPEPGQVLPEDEVRAAVEELYR